MHPVCGNEVQAGVWNIPRALELRPKQLVMDVKALN